MSYFNLVNEFNCRFKKKKSLQVVSYLNAQYVARNIALVGAEIKMHVKLDGVDGTSLGTSFKYA